MPTEATLGLLDLTVAIAIGDRSHTPGREKRQDWYHSTRLDAISPAVPVAAPDTHPWSQKPLLRVSARGRSRRAEPPRAGGSARSLTRAACAAAS